LGLGRCGDDNRHARPAEAPLRGPWLAIRPDATGSPGWHAPEALARANGAAEAHRLTVHPPLLAVQEARASPNVPLPDAGLALAAAARRVVRGATQGGVVVVDLSGPTPFSGGPCPGRVPFPGSPSGHHGTGHLLRPLLRRLERGTRPRTAEAHVVAPDRDLHLTVTPRGVAMRRHVSSRAGVVPRRPPKEGVGLLS
jgi:hypothetical protein